MRALRAKLCHHYIIVSFLLLMCLMEVRYYLFMVHDNYTFIESKSFHVAGIPFNSGIMSRVRLVDLDVGICCFKIR